jgi:hypothetical protein
MAKRNSESAELDWDADDEGEDGPAADVVNGSPAPAKAGFHLRAARKIEEARERRQLRKAIEDFDDYDV